MPAETDLLPDSRRFLQAALDALPARVCIVDGAGTVVAANAAWTREAHALGAGDGGIGLPYADAGLAAVGVGGEHARDAAEGIRAVLEGRAAAFAGDFPCGAPGGWRWVNLRATCFEVDGCPHVLVVHEDATARREAEARFRAAADGGLDAFLLLSPVRGPAGRITDFRVEHLNAAGAAMLETGASAAVGRLLGEVAPALKARGLLARYARVAETGRALEEEYATPGPGAGWVHHHVVPVEGGGVAVTSRDVTARRAAEAALHEGEARYRAVLENSLDGVLLCAPGGAILSANPAACSIFGFGEGELRRLGWAALVPAGSAGSALPAELEPGGRWRGPLTLVRRGGEEFPAEASCARFHDGTGAARYTVVVRDVADRVRADETLRERDEQLRQAQKMEAIGRLAGGVAHDFNNLLTAIQGNTQLLLSAPEGSASPELAEIHRAAEQAVRLTRQLLAFSRRQVLQPEVLGVNTVVRGMEGMLRRLIGEDVELVAALDSGLRAVSADPGQLEQVILNLAINARDAMPRGGMLRIATRNALPDEAVAAGLLPRDAVYVVLSVTDDGVGIPEGLLPRIFDPFFTTKEQGRGTGLGLSTVYGIVQQSGGAVQVQSRPGEGSTFTVYLPAAGEGAEPATARRAVPAAAGGSETVLLVEDEDAVRSFARKVLERSGYRVLEAASGEEAVRIARGREAGAIHAMLTDVVMPRMSGADLAALLAPAQPEMRVVFMSGYTEEAIGNYVPGGSGGPGVPFLEKPFSAADLTRKLREVLDGVVEGCGTG